jgi:hypothetical protein
MTIEYHWDLQQGTDEWLATRRGIITASEMGLLLTPTLKTSNNEKTRAHIYELASQRISGYVEPRFITDDMLRGHEDEADALSIYMTECADNAKACGIITNDQWGFTIGYSPDCVVGNDGLVECKSRRQKFQVQTILEHIASGEGTIPTEFMLQCQTGLLVAERDWLDFISYCGGLPMVVIRVYNDETMQAAIIEAATEAERKIATAVSRYFAAIQTYPRAYPTERRERGDMII